jgi:hypothetical protein
MNPMKYPQSYLALEAAQFDRQPRMAPPLTWDDREAQQIPSYEQTAISPDPLIDLGAGFSGGFGANIMRKGLSSALRSGIAATLAEYPIGLATAGAANIDPRLAMPVSIIGGMASGPTFERALSNAMAGKGHPLRTAQKALGNAMGQAGSGGVIQDLAEMPRFKALGLDAPVTPRDQMTAAEELANIKKGPRATNVEFKPNFETGVIESPIKIHSMDYIRKNKNLWFKRSLETDEARGFYNRIAERGGQDGGSAIHVNQKTGFSLDLSTSCPKRAAACPYCYVENARVAEKLYGMKGGVKKVVETPYQREILAMPPEIINRLNEQGGLRAHSFGDYRPQQDFNDWNMILHDAEAKGLMVKAITKQPEFVEAFGDHPNLRINISIDDLPGEMSQAPALKQAIALKAGRPNIKIRSVALNEEQAWRQAQNPDIDVVTLYHGLTRDKLLKVIQHQNPGLVKKVGLKALKKEIWTWQDMSPHQRGNTAFKRLSKAFPNKICCQSGKCGGDPTKCGFGAQAVGGLIVGVTIPEILEREDDSTSFSGVGEAGI